MGVVCVCGRGVLNFCFGKLATFKVYKCKRDRESEWEREREYSYAYLALLLRWILRMFSGHPGMQGTWGWHTEVKNLYASIDHPIQPPKALTSWEAQQNQSAQSLFSWGKLSIVSFTIFNLMIYTIFFLFLFFVVVVVFFLLYWIFYWEPFDLSIGKITH